MFGTTMLLTVGHALDRAKEEGMVVRLNIAGDWVTGQVINSDGHGVAVLESNGDLCVVRQEAVTAVRMPSVESGPHVPSQSPQQRTEFVVPSTAPAGAGAN
ncbi:hypothetical protein [Marmoricola sp. URHB0036]|jgi:hypothetical protein|uniref:hypothetical protein n=1 Tax=Marmoricola sp. URHB0036 TaxID=1298863 RepID=UPI000403EB29|nr:hypothetical protein [Marmoricola sp. URHB0036]